MPQKVTAKVFVKDELWNRLKKSLAGIRHAYTTVGVHEDAGDSPSGKSLAFIAAVHEYGCEITVTPAMRGWLGVHGIHLKKETTTIKIPERSFERGWVDEARNEIEQMLKKLAEKIIDGKLTAKQALGQLGEFAVSGMQSRLLKGLEPELSEATYILRASQDYNGSTVPLVGQSNQIVQSITHREVIL